MVASSSMKSLITTLGLIGSCTAQVPGGSFPPFDEYVATYGNQYPDEQDLKNRRAQYDMKVQEINVHNANPAGTWKMTVNKFTLMTDEEMNSFYGLAKTPGKMPGFSTMSSDGDELKSVLDDGPSSFDWRDHRPSVVTAVKNQGHCGSCWAFAASAVLESAIALETDLLFELSPQQLTSCTPNPDECGGQGGCTGATAQLAFNYTVQAGISSLWKWPYTSGIQATNGDCFPMTGVKKAVAGITGYHQLTQNHAKDLMRAVLTNPVSISVAASRWGAYDKGIFSGCDVDHPIVNHAVVLMGFGDETDPNNADPNTNIKSYWLVRNSWGPTWGEAGYIRLQRFPDGEPCGIDNEPLSGYSCKDSAPPSIRACGMCGILADSAYPTGAFLGAPTAPEDPALDTPHDVAVDADIVEEFSVESGMKTGMAALSPHVTHQQSELMSRVYTSLATGLVGMIVGFVVASFAFARTSGSSDNARDARYHGLFLTA